MQEDEPRLSGTSCVTIISPERENDISTVSEQKSTKGEVTSAATSTTLDGDSQRYCDLTSSKDVTTATSVLAIKHNTDQSIGTVSDCSSKLDKLSISEQPIPSTLTEGASPENSTSTVEEQTPSVSALFVFGGMDTQGTVHDDSFVFVPQ